MTVLSMSLIRKEWDNNGAFGPFRLSDRGSTEQVPTVGTTVQFVSRANLPGRYRSSTNLSSDWVSFVGYLCGIEGISIFQLHLNCSKLSHSHGFGSVVKFVAATTLLWDIYVILCATFNRHFPPSIYIYI